MHADKHQNFYRLALSFLIEVARHVRSTRNRQLIKFLQYIKKTVMQLLLCSIMIQSIQIFMVFQSYSLLLVVNCFLSNAILRKIWEMTRNLGAHSAQLLKSTISKFWHSFFMVITLHNLKVLLSLLFLSHSIVSNFYQPANWNFLSL